ncbi:MAG TPA: guanylate kinase [Gemmataceae bacterium]|nr:guanylate kinase [Gemmataceae bacterium]
MAQGPLVVVSGPSGVGKTTVVDRLMSRGTLPLRRAVTATTRDPRDGEVDGTSYHFWSKDKFLKAVDDGRMLEYAVVHNRDLYGTPRSEVDEARAAGQGVILVIDVQGAELVRTHCPGDHLSVFIEAPSDAELEARLRSRKSEPEEAIQRRLASARKEMAVADRFHHRIVNRDLDAAVGELEQLIRAQFTTHKGY